MASVPISEHPLETELTALERDLDSTPTSEWHGRSWHKLVEMQWAAGSLGQDHPKKQNLLDRCTTLERRLLRSLEDIPVRAPEAQKNPRKFSRKSSWTFSFVLSKVVSIGIYWGSSTMKSSLLTLKKDFDQRNQGQLYNMVCQLSPLLLRFIAQQCEFYRNGSSTPPPDLLALCFVNIEGKYVLSTTGETVRRIAENESGTGLALSVFLLRIFDRIMNNKDIFQVDEIQDALRRSVEAHSLAPMEKKLLAILERSINEVLRSDPSLSYAEMALYKFLSSMLRSVAKKKIAQLLQPLHVAFHEAAPPSRKKESEEKPQEKKTSRDLLGPFFSGEDAQALVQLLGPTVAPLVLGEVLLEKPHEKAASTSDEAFARPADAIAPLTLSGVLDDLAELFLSDALLAREERVQIHGPIQDALSSFFPHFFQILESTHENPPPPAIARFFEQKDDKYVLNEAGRLLLSVIKKAPVLHFLQRTCAEALLSAENALEDRPIPKEIFSLLKDSRNMEVVRKFALSLLPEEVPLPPVLEPLREGLSDFFKMMVTTLFSPRGPLVSYSPLIPSVADNDSIEPSSATRETLLDPTETAESSEALVPQGAGEADVSSVGRDFLISLSERTLISQIPTFLLHDVLLHHILLQKSHLTDLGLSEGSLSILNASCKLAVSEAKKIFSDPETLLPDGLKKIFLNPRPPCELNELGRKMKELIDGGEELELFLEANLLSLVAGIVGGGARIQRRKDGDLLDLATLCVRSLTHSSPLSASGVIAIPDVLKFLFPLGLRSFALPLVLQTIPDAAFGEIVPVLDSEVLRRVVDSIPFAISMVEQASQTPERNPQVVHLLDFFSSLQQEWGECRHLEKKEDALSGAICDLVEADFPEIKIPRSILTRGISSIFPLLEVPACDSMNCFVRKMPDMMRTAIAEKPQRTRSIVYQKNLSLSTIVQNFLRHTREKEMKAAKAEGGIGGKLASFKHSIVKKIVESAVKEEDLPPLAERCRTIVARAFRRPEVDF